MNPKPPDGGVSGALQPVNGKIENKDNGKLEPVLRFWGSYCYADVSDWTKDEIDDLSDSLEMTPVSPRRPQSIHRVHRAIGGYSEDE